MAKEKFSHIPSTGWLGEGVLTTATICTWIMALGIVEAKPDQAFFLALPSVLTAYVIRLLWLAAQERRNQKIKPE